MRGRDERGLMLGTGLLALAIQVPIFDRWLSFLDEGYLLAIADAINRGKLLYRDVYVDAPFPGAFYLLAAWFRLAGTSVWTSRLLAVIVFTLLAVLIVRIGRELVSRRAALALVVLVLCYRIWAFPHWHIVSYSSTSATFLAAGVAVVFHHLRRPSRRSLVASGLLVGAGILCKQDYGVGVGASLGLFLLLRPLLARRLGAPSPGAVVPAALFATGAAALVVPVLALFAAAGAFGALVEQTFFRPLSIVTGFTYARLPALTPLLHQDAALRADIGSYLPAILLTLRWETIAAGWMYRETSVWDAALKLVFYAPILLWAIAALVWRPGFRRGEPYDLAARHLLLLAWAGGLLLAFNRPRDWVHLMMIYPPALVLATALAAPVLARLPALATVATVVPALVLLAASSADLTFDLRRHFSWPLRAERAGIYAEERHGAIIEDVLRYVDEHAPPGTPVPVYPIQPMLGFLAGRETADGFFVIWPGQAPERDERIMADIAARDVRVVIYSLSQYASLGRFRDNAPALYDYLAHHFRIDAVFTRETFGPLLTALVRRTEPTAGSLVDRAVDARPPGTMVPALWPFVPVLAERVGTPAAPVVARIAVDVPPDGATLAFAYGINPDRWLGVPSGPFTFVLDVEDGDEPPAEVFRATVDPYGVLADRRWIDASVDLRAHAGRSVTLAFAISAPSEPATPGDVAGWAEPRLVPSSRPAAR